MPSKLSVATFNLYNLNQPGLPIYRSPGWTAAEYDKKIAWTSSLLSTGGADVWGFQEHWHNDALAEAVRGSALKSSHKVLAPRNHKGTSGISCAALVKRDILVPNSAQWITDFPPNFRLESGGDDPQSGPIEFKIDSFSRPVLQFAIKPAASKSEIAVFVCHLKSKRPTRIDHEDWFEDSHRPHQTAIGAALSTLRRTAEATALRMILNAHLEGTGKAAIVLGDLNDGVQSNTLNIITSQPTFSVGARVTRGADKGLYSVATLLQMRSERDVYYTHIYQNSIETLDHILVSEELYELSRDREWGLRFAEIHNDHISQDNHRETGTGDHGVVVAHFGGKSPL